MITNLIYLMEIEIILLVFDFSKVVIPFKEFFVQKVFMMICSWFSCHMKRPSCLKLLNFAIETAFLFSFCVCFHPERYLQKTTSWMLGFTAQYAK